MTLGVHALYVAHVIAFLLTVTGTFRCPDASQSAYGQAGSGAHGGTAPTGDGSPRGGAESGSYGGTLETAFASRLLRHDTAYLLVSKVSVFGQYILH